MKADSRVGWPESLGNLVRGPLYLKCGDQPVAIVKRPDVDFAGGKLFPVILIVGEAVPSRATQPGDFID